MSSQVKKLNRDDVIKQWRYITWPLDSIARPIHVADIETKKGRCSFSMAFSWCDWNLIHAITIRKMMPFYLYFTYLRYLYNYDYYRNKRIGSMMQTNFFEWKYCFWNSSRIYLNQRYHPFVKRIILDYY